MIAYDAVVAFKDQVTRRTGLKTVLAPTPLKDPGPVVKISVRKVLRHAAVQARQDPEREIRLTVRLDGMVESLTGLKAAVEACDALASFLTGATRLEDDTGASIASTRVTETVNEEDGILEDPESGAVAWVQDDHFVTIRLPV